MSLAWEEVERGRKKSERESYVIVPISLKKKKKFSKRLLTPLGIVKIRGIRTIDGHNDFYLHLCCQRNLMNKQKVDTEAGIKGLGEPDVVQKRQG